MKQALGNHSGSVVLYPIAENGNYSTQPNQYNFGNPAQSKKVIYFGNLYDYGPMLQHALESFQKSVILRLIVRGANPQWPDKFQQNMRHLGLWLDFLPRSELSELHDWLKSADFFLVPMLFDPSMRRRMETSFPSKLVEYVQFGKPVVVWGPEYSSAIQWAKQYDAATAVTSPDPRELVKTLEGVSQNPEKCAFYAQKAYEVARSAFDSDTIQRQFMDALKQTVA
jgi:glycosyltransferase involved in cell wall biosynthesis